jgi:HEAT repeat protein
VRLLNEQIVIVQALGAKPAPGSFEVLQMALEARSFAQDSAEGLRLRERTYQRRRAAMVALSKFKEGQAATKIFIALLGDSDAHIRADAARLLGELDAGEGVLPLLAALQDPVADVRLEAASALGKLGDARAVPPLISKLTDNNTLVRERAVLALATLHDPRAIAPLKALRRTTTDARVARSLTQALTQMGLPE